MDAGPETDGGESMDAPETPDGGEPLDGGSLADGGEPMDGSSLVDGGGSMDDSGPMDAGDLWDGGSSAALPVNLGAVGNFVILAGTTLGNTSPSIVTGNVGHGTTIGGFTLLTPDLLGTFSTSPEVTGRIYAAADMPPTPANLATAIENLGAALTDAEGRTPGVTWPGAGNIDGMVLGAGVYRWSTVLAITAATSVTLMGSATDVWIFQIPGTMSLGAAARIELAGGALPKNVYWQVGGAVTLLAGAHCEGVILTRSTVGLGAGASITGRLLALTTVTIATSTVVEPAP